MKIGVFTDSYRPYTSGVVRSIELFTKEFTARGHNVYIFGPDQPFFKARVQKEEGIFRFVSIPAPTFSDFVIPIPFSAQLGPTIKRIGLDLIHVHSPFLLGRLGARAARRYDIPLVFTYHTMYDQYIHYIPLPRKTSRKLVQNIGRDFCNRCSLVITPSRPVKRYLQQLNVRAPIKVIPTGIELEEFENTDSSWLRKNYPIQEKEKVLLFVGRLGKEKNLVFLLRSFARIIKVFPSTKLVLIGSGPQEATLRKMCAGLGIDEKVIFTGLLPRSKIVHCYAGADIFTFPSVTETQGLVIGEAKAGGIPVVAINAFGVSDMVRHGEDGYLTSLSLDNFTQRIMQLLWDPQLRERMSKKALENVHYLSSSYCAEQMLDAYAQLISPPSFSQADLY